MDEEEELFLYEITFVTKTYRQDFLNDKRFPKKIEIFPFDDVWTLNNLAIFLNEQPFLKTSHTGFTKKSNVLIQSLSFHFQFLDCHIFIKIEDKIKVKVTTSYLIREWDNIKYNFITDLGAQNKILDSMHFDRLIFFKKKISISDSSKAFTKEIPLFLFSKNDFGNALYYFLTRIVKNGLP